MSAITVGMCLVFRLHLNHLNGAVDFLEESESNIKAQRYML